MESKSSGVSSESILSMYGKFPIFVLTLPAKCRTVMERFEGGGYGRST